MGGEYQLQNKCTKACLWRHWSLLCCDQQEVVSTWNARVFLESRCHARRHGLDDAGRAASFWVKCYLYVYGSRPSVRSWCGGWDYLLLWIPGDSCLWVFHRLGGRSKYSYEEDLIAAVLVFGRNAAGLRRWKSEEDWTSQLEAGGWKGGDRMCLQRGHRNRVSVGCCGVGGTRAV